MTPVRLVAALAALLTALLLQASLIGPLTVPVPVSLPALLVAAIALVDGPGAGLSFGFAAGLIADLGSEHPAGVLALCWLGIGLVCGVCASRQASLRRDAAFAALVCGLAGIVASVLLAIVDADSSDIALALRDAIPTTLFDALLGLAVVPLVRVFLRTDALRAPRPVLVLGDLT